MYNNEEKALYSLTKLIDTCDTLNDQYEILVINDGSSDDTVSIIELIAQKTEIKNKLKIV